MSETSRNNAAVDLLINGAAVRAEPGTTVIEAAWAAHVPHITGIGCLEGVCGTCRILVRNGRDVKVALGCETFVENGMEALFLPPPMANGHHYELADLADGWDIQTRFHEIFPEASRCRHCNGCVRSCPKGISVEEGVTLAADGRFREAGELFLECVMCELCDTTCPEHIAPSHVGLFCRRTTAYFHLRPPNLIHKLEEIRADRKKGRQ